MLCMQQKTLSAPLHRLPAASANTDMLMLPVPALQKDSPAGTAPHAAQSAHTFFYSAGTGQRSQKLSGACRKKVGAITWEDQGQCLHHPPLAGHAFVSYFTHPHCHTGCRPVKSLAHLNLGVRSSFRSGASDDTTAACSKCTPGGAVCAWDVSSLARPYSVRGLELICPPRPQKP